MSRLLGMVGHNDVLQALCRSLDRNAVPNGILLHGSPGRGRMTLARKLAAELISEPGDAESKDRIEREAHPDLVVVRRGEESREILIAQVRELKEWFSLQGVLSNRRVAIVQDADRLTQEAGNALLKTLEEPPIGSHLILIARGRDLIMETLASRCQAFHMGPVPRADVEEFLRSKGVSPQSAGLLSLLSEGRPGWALRVYEKDLEKNLLAPVRELLRCHSSPFRSAESLVLQSKSSAKLEGARERLTEWLEVAMRYLQLRMRLAMGLPDGQLLVEVDATTSSILSTWSFQDLESALEAMADTVQILMKNVSLDLALESLGGRMGRLTSVAETSGGV
ncbi:MAG TPA: hypothetical protein PKA37_00430 [Planctomycetota bacterium]|nr:hypothetical protein [Planctomycetota bacterium]